MTFNISVMRNQRWMNIFVFLIISLLFICYCSSGDIQVVNPQEIENNNNSSESLIILDKLVTEEPMNATHWNERGKVLYDMGRYNDALFSFKNASELKNEISSEILYNQGVTHLMLGDFTVAEGELNRSLINNVTPDAFFYHGVVLLGLKKYNQSISSFQNYLNISPHDTYAWFNLGQAFEQNRNFDRAVYAYEAAVLIDPLYAKPWFFIGNIYSSFGNNTKAIRAYENYTKLIPEDDLGWFYLSQTYKNNKQINESVTAINKAIQINPSEIQYQEYLKYYQGREEEENDWMTQAPLSPVSILIAVMGAVLIVRIQRKEW